MRSAARRSYGRWFRLESTVRRSSIRQWQSTKTTTPAPSAANNGEQAYERYLHARQKLQDIQKERERLHSQQLYEAWERAQQAETTTTAKASKKPGVAVIQTLAKQKRKEEEHEEQPEQYWKEQMQLALQQAAQEYQHPTAWVQWGNQQLSLLQQQGAKTEISSDETTITNLIQNVLECYEKACTLGSTEGCYNWGHLLWTGWPPRDNDNKHHTGPSSSRGNSGVVLLPADRTKALDAFRKAMELGDADAMYFYGVWCINDCDKKDAALGLKWIQKAAASGHGGALYYLALMHLNGHEGLGIAACSETFFVQRLDAAVAAGDPEALFLRGHSQYHGDNGYPLDYAAALRDFLAAAERGHADAAVSAGAMLHPPNHPGGVQQDQRRAFELYQYAGELGNREGWRNVVACYLTGEGVPQSKGMAKYIAETMLKENAGNTSAPS